MHLTVINPSSSSVQTDFTVIVTGSNITGVGPSSSTAIPPGAKIIDATGKFLIPGLADMHLHLTGAGEPSGSREFILPLLLANGITTVRDMGGNVTLLKQLREEINSGKRLGPQIFFTGPYLDGDPPSFQPSIVIHDDAEAARTVQQLKSAGVDFIKVQSRLQPSVYFAIARASKKMGVRFVGHVPDSLTVAEASEAGQASVEHLTGVLLGCSSREIELRDRQLMPAPPGETLLEKRARQRTWQKDLLDSYSKEKAADLFRKFVAKGTVQVPTLPLLFHIPFLLPHTARLQSTEEKYLPQDLRAIWKRSLAESLAGLTEEDVQIRAQLMQRSLSTVKGMHSAGVPILAGTDTTAPGVFPGFALHEDLFFLWEAGLTPMQTLRAATAAPAEFLGLSSRQGSITAGQRADLVLLNASPLDDIRNVREIRAVFLKGQFLDRSTLDSLLQSAQSFAVNH